MPTDEKLSQRSAARLGESTERAKAWVTESSDWLSSERMAEWIEQSASHGIEKLAA